MLRAGASLALALASPGAPALAEAPAATAPDVTTFDGRPALAVMIEYVKTHGRVLFDGVSAVVRGSVDGLTALLQAIPSPLLILGVAALSSLRSSSPRCCSS